MIDMRKIKFKYLVPASILATLGIIYSCNKDINVPVAGSLLPSVLANKAGVDGLLIGAYSMLDGYTATGQYTSWETSIDNWVYGGVAADDAFKGSNTTDQPNIPPLANHSVTAANEFLQEKWAFCFNAIQRANDAIRELPLVTDGSISADYAAEVIAEARFLRGVFHLELAKMWRNVPYVSEGISYANGNLNVANGPIWDSIEIDLTAAMGVLPKTQSQIGRANFYAAEAFLAKAYMFDHQYDKALPLLTDIIDNGNNSAGVKFALGPFEDNFDASKRNNAESVFCVQMTVNDGSGGNNSNPGAILNYAAGTYTGCCGFYQPSYSLGNAFKVTAAGLPMLGTDANGTPNYNLVLLHNDHGLLSSDPFTPPSDALDPRIDWTLGRRGIPYLDWALCGGEAWSRGDIVPYNPIKNVFWHKDMATTSEVAEGWAGNQGNAINYNLIRLADVILWRAECEVEASDFTNAEADVNLIRNRMANHPEYWVHTYVDNTDPSKGFTTTPAANYHISPYPAGAFAGMGQDGARDAVYMERQLELAMEGHRFFDLQRWDGIYGGPKPAGYMAGLENAFIKSETSWPPQNGNHAVTNPVLQGHTFTKGTNELWPIPINEIDISAGPLKQNPGYN
jgi:hypothetical protein